MNPSIIFSRRFAASLAVSGACWTAMAPAANNSSLMAAKEMDAKDAAQFDQEHYPNGPNERFMGATNKLNEVFGGSKGRFENPELRDIAKCAQTVAKSLGILRGLRVMDVGSGTGLMLPYLSAATGAEGEVIAVEISPGFLELLQRRVDGNIEEKSRLQNVRVVRGTESSTGVSSESVDLAFFCDVYHHVMYPEIYMASVFKTLVPGGRLVVLDFHRDPARHKSHPMPWIMEHVRAGQDEFRREIEACGFKYVSEVLVEGLEENYIMVFEKPDKT